MPTMADLEHLVSSPLAASTAAAMTDTNKVYVYTGSETGMTNGDWYYYSGNAWVSGGVYNAVAVDTDDTLTVEGMAADAKATGDENLNLKNTMSDYAFGINKTFIHTGSLGYDSFPCLLLEGVEYTITNNNESHTMAARIYKEDQSYVSLGDIPKSGTLTFIVPSGDFVRVGGYMYNNESFTITNEYSNLKYSNKIPIIENNL